MRRPIALLGLWLTAAIVCTTLGWFTVGIVSGQSRESSLPQLIQTTTTQDDAEAGVVRPESAIASGSTDTTFTSTSTSTTTTAPPPTPAPATSTTITSSGGSVAVRYDGSAGTVSLLWAVPRDDFTMDLEHTGPDKVEVRFESDDAESRVFAWWDGAPRKRVVETD